MNLAIADVRVLAQAFEAFYKKGDDAALAGYSDTALKRVWRTEYFSWWMTNLLHTFDTHSPFERQLQRAEQEMVVSSRAMATALAENYVGAF
jgi:p-hydroxybenzoate 3-monooxygenase